MNLRAYEEEIDNMGTIRNLAKKERKRLGSMINLKKTIT